MIKNKNEIVDILIKLREKQKEREAIMNDKS